MTPVIQTGHMEAKHISASDFKARCLAILDEVQRTGSRVTILKRGTPVAQLIAAEAAERPSAWTRLKGSVTLAEECVDPVLPAEAWEANST